MTVTYTGEVATCTGLGCFWKLLFRWRGSIYKLLWPNLIVYSILYFSLSGSYRFLLNSEQRTFFEKMSLHCQVYGDLIPVSFILGFYVSVVIKRWWDQYLCLPWPDNLALFVSSLVHGQDERGRMMRRTIMRYVNLSLLLTLRMISPRVKKRFPTLDHVVEAGWMLPGEKKIFEDLEHKTPHTKYWMPLVWAGGIVTRARKENRIKDDFALKTLIDELNIFRGGCGGMLNYDWISIPLVYTQLILSPGGWLQVVTLAVYVFFLSTLMGNQYLDPSKGYPKHQIDLFLPVFTFLQFFFYMGWLKVAESLVNPFGEDDDDFELNWLLDRNLQISYVIVDEMHQEHPEMLKDQYWDEVFPTELPYTAAAKQYQTGPPQHSAEEVEVPSHQAEFMPLDTVVEEKIEVSESDSREDIDMQITHPSFQRGETHPMKIKRQSRTPSTGMTSASEQSTLSSKGKNSVLNLLSRIFHHKRHSKEEVNQLGSSASLRSRRGNRSTSRLSSVSHSMAPSRSSFLRESVPYNDFQLEVFTMSDLDISNTGIGNPDSNDQKPPSADVSLSSTFVNPGKNDFKEVGNTVDSEASNITESHKRDPKLLPYCPILSTGFDRREISPSHMFSPEYFGKRDSLARVVVQNNSPVYHVFTPVATTPFVPTLKFPPSQEPLSQFEFCKEQQTKGLELKEKCLASDICREGVITILPPNDAPIFKISKKSLENLRESDVDSQYHPPGTSLNYVKSFSQLEDPALVNEYTCISGTSSSPQSRTLQPPPLTNFSSFLEVTNSKTSSQNKMDNSIPVKKDSSGDRNLETESLINKLNESMTEPGTNFTEGLEESTTDSFSKIENIQVSAPDPTTPSAAIPVPALSQAHATPVDLELGRRPLMHELEPIIEHRDEGTSSIGSSVHDLNSEHSITNQNKEKIEIENRNKS